VAASKPQGSRWIRIWLLPFSILAGSALAIAALTYWIDSRNAANMRLLELVTHLNPDSAVETLTNAMQVAAGLLAIAVTVVAIVVELAANRYTHRITELFVGEPINFAVMGLFVVTAMQCLTVALTYDDAQTGYVPTVGVIVAFAMLALSMLMLLPYFAFVFNFLNPIQIVDRIRKHTIVGITRPGGDVARKQAEAVRGVEQLADVALNAMEHKDKGVSMASVDALRALVEDYQKESSSSKPATPAVPGFGLASNTAKAPGFDVPLSVDASVPLEKRYDSRVIEYVDRMLKDYDKNSDGFVDNIEWKDGRWSTPPEESDTNKDGKLSRAELCERIARRFGLQNSPPGSSSSNSGGSSSRDSSSSSSSSSKPGDEFSKYKDYAASLIKQHDRNKNGVLEKDEWNDLKSEHRAADANSDSVITADELALKLQAYSSGSNSSGGSSNSYGSKGGSSSGGDSQRRGWGSWGNKSGSSTAAKPGEKKDYRFQTATERLPKGLPDWFLRSDVDSDGQVAMVEYSTSWSDTTAAEFQKYDLDGDGFITPQECLSTMAPTKK
jgi:uncharacterized membrane protein YgcG